MEVGLDPGEVQGDRTLRLQAHSCQETKLRKGKAQAHNNNNGIKSNNRKYEIVIFDSYLGGKVRSSG